MAATGIIVIITKAVDIIKVASGSHSDRSQLVTCRIRAVNGLPFFVGTIMVASELLEYPSCFVSTPTALRITVRHLNLMQANFSVGTVASTQGYIT